MIVIVAERGGGKSSFLRRVVADYGERAVLSQVTHGTAESALSSLGAALGAGDASSESIGAALRERGIRVVAWDDVHHLCQPVLGGQREIDRAAEVLAPFRGKITLVATVDSAAWQYMSRVREGRLTDAAAVELPAWTEGQIGELIEARAEEMGIELSYHRLTFPRMLLEHEFATPEEGLRASFRRLLWSEADGNPFVAMRLLADALIVETDGRLAVQLPKSPAASDLDGVRITTLLVLRFLLQTDGATSEELIVGLRYPEEVIRASLLTSTMRGWIEQREDRFYVTWDWYRTITRVLVRNNFLASAREGVEASAREGSVVRQRQPLAVLPARRSSR